MQKGRVNNMTKKKSKIKHIISNNLFMLKTLAKYAPDYMFLTFFKSILASVRSIYGVYFIKLLYDTYAKSGATFTDVVLVVVPYLVFNVVCTFINFLMWYIWEPKSKQRLQYRMQDDLYSKAKEIDLSCYDDPEFYDSFVWAMRTADSEALGVADKIAGLVSSIISISGILGIVATVDPLIILIVLFCVGISFVFNLMNEKLGLKQSEEDTPINRRKEYSIRVFYLADYAKEIRLSRIADKVLDEYDKTLGDQIKLIMKYAKNWVALSIAEYLSITALQDMGITLLLVYRVMGGSISLGDYAAVANASWNIYANIHGLLSSFSGFAVSSMYIDKYRTFIEYENRIQSGEWLLPKFESLKVSGVDFAYESNEENTLKGVNFEIKKGEKIAIVGYNGAGKTTLIKLLMRLYDPSNGHIEYNGRDIKDYKLDEYRNNFGTIFQDYKVFAATVAENVLGGEYTPEKEKVVLDALHRATFDDKLAELPNGIHTNLTREFDEEGVNLSGGEAQKIAIARAFARDCDIIIMDEPSSALDPISEYELNHSIKENSKDKTVIFISHRLSTTRMADRIYMFEDGRIIEQGSHEELMKLNGKYAYMFNLQAEKYK